MKILISLLPVFIFLGLLVYLDSFKLVRKSIILSGLLWGVAAAGISYYFNTGFIRYSGISFSNYSQFFAPIIEELLKSFFLIFMIKRNKVGFMIDGAIIGFATGAGFAFIENLFYIVNIDSDNLFLWIVRGFGTGVMHCGTTCIIGILAMYFANKSEKNKLSYFLPGLLAAIAIHSIYNQFIISPVLSTVLLTVVMPLLIVLIFQKNENSLRQWLDLELDTEAKMLGMIRSGKFSESAAGKYIISIKSRFPKEVIFDIICFIELFLELSIKAKGRLLMIEYGFEAQKEPDIESKLSELKFLRKSIGKTGLLAISPILRMKPKDLWKLSSLEY